MKVCYLITRGHTMGGANVHVRDMAQALLERGHEPIVLIGETGPFVDDLKAARVPFEILPNLQREVRPLQDLKGLFEVIAALRRIKPDILSTHTAKAGFLGRIAAKICGVPAFYTAHGWAFADGVSARERSVYLFLERWGAYIGQPIITVCEQDRIYALANGVGQPQQIETIHNGMPPIPPALEANAEAEPPNLIMVARFMPQKDHTTLLRALARIKDLSWEIDLVGPGPLMDDAQALCADLGLTDRVRFLGERRDVAELMAQSQIFLLITNWEGFPRSILEAMRAGLPIVATNIDGIPEAVTENETGFLIGRKDVDGLTARLRELIVDPSLRRRLGQAGRERFLRQFTFDRTFSGTVRKYSSALRAGIR